MPEPRRGDLWWIIDPDENRHLGVVVSADERNKHVDNVIMALCTSVNGARVYESTEVELTGLDTTRPTKVQGDALYTLSKDRLIERVDVLAGHQMARLNECMKHSLGIFY